MNDRFIRIREQRARLIERAARQRGDLARDIAALSGPIAVADRGLAIIGYIKTHPVIVAAAAALVVVLRPRRSLGWARRGLMLWQTWRWLASRYQTH